MKTRPDLYRDREQSLIKHDFLIRYLEASAYKIFQGRSPIFNFVDALAGPWRITDANYSDASFSLARQTLETVRSVIDKDGSRGLKIRFCFCEKRREAVAELRKYAEKFNGFEIHVFHGLFENNLHNIASTCQNGFTFCFIDPTGWNLNSESVFRFLKECKGEALINFMEEDINRHATYSQVSKSFGRFLDYPEWSNEFNSLPPYWGNSQKILHLFKKKIKESGAATYIPDFPIMKPRENRIKMRLLLCTHSPRGLEVFRDVQEKVEFQQAETRLRLREEEETQGSLFSEDQNIAMLQQANGIGCHSSKNEAEERIKKHLSKRGPQKFSTIAVDILEHVSMRMTDIKNLLNDMKNRGIIHFQLPPKKKKPQDDTVIYLQLE